MNLFELAWPYFVGTIGGVGFWVGQLVSGTFVGGQVGSWAGVTVVVILLIVISLPFRADRDDPPTANRPNEADRQNPPEP